MKTTKIPPQVAEYIKNCGTCIVTSEGDRYYHLPDWLNETDREDVYVVLQEHELPKEVLRRTLTLEEALERLLTLYSQEDPAITAKFLFETMEDFQHAVRDIQKL